MSKLVCTAQLLQNTVNYKELNFYQYRQLLKCFLGDEIFTDFIFTNTDSIIKDLTCLNQKQIDNLSFLDYCLLLFDIRQTCIGNAIYLYIDTSEQKQIKINLLINDVIEKINNDKLHELLKSEQIESCKVEYRIPSIKEIIALEKEKEIYTPYTFFLKTITLSNTVISLEDYSYIEREEIVQKIPLKVMTALTKRTHSIIEFCNSLNLLSSIKSDLFNKELILTLNSEIIAFIIKLFFNTRLESIYEYIFALCKMSNFSGSFLDNCSPGEFYIFVKKLEEFNAKNALNTRLRGQDNLPPINNSIAEFGME